jgi:hypothetical protein
LFGNDLDLNNYSKSNSKHKYNDKEKNLIEIGHSENDNEFCFILGQWMGYQEKYKLKFLIFF